MGKKSSYLKKAAKFATGQGKQKTSDKDGSRHRTIQQDEHDSLQRSSTESEQQPHTAASTAVVGLSNLGNTCFFNSSVQLLLACSPLQQLLLQPDHCLSKGPLGFALQQTAKYASGQQSSGVKGSSVYNPQSLLSAVCCHAPVFKGKQQHDSHELMRMLLDGLQLQEQRYKRELAKQQDGSSSSKEGKHAQQQQQEQNGSVHGADRSCGEDSSSSSSSNISSISSSSSSSSRTSNIAVDVVLSDTVALCTDSSNSSSTTSSRTSQEFGIDGASCTNSGRHRPHGNSFEAFASNNDVNRSMDALEEGASVLNSTCSVQQLEDEGQQQQQSAQALNEALPSRQSKTAAAGDTCTACGTALEVQQQQQQQHNHQHLSTQSTQHQQPGVPHLHQHQQPQPQHKALMRKSLLPPEPPATAGSTSIDQVFGGVLVSTVTCTSCGHTSVSYEPFLDLSLPIPVPAAEGSLTRKGSLLARLAGRSSGGGRRKGKAAAGDDGGETTAATAAGEAAGQQDDRAAAAAAALHNGKAAAGKKLTKKERRKLQQEQKKAAIEAKRLARLAAQQQQQQCEEDDEQLPQQQQQQQQGAGQQLPAAGAGQPPSADASHSSRGLPDATKAEQQQGGGGSGAAAGQQQRQPLPVAGCSPVSAASATRAAGDSDGDSTASAWTDLGAAALPASPPTHLVSCWGASWDSISPKPPPPPPSQQQPAGTAANSHASSTAHRPTHRRFSSLGSLSALTSSAKGGLTSLFGWQGRGSRDGSVHEGLGGPGGVTNENNGRPLSPPPRPASALGFVSMLDVNGLTRISTSDDGAAGAAAEVTVTAGSFGDNELHGRSVQQLEHSNSGLCSPSTSSAAATAVVVSDNSLPRQGSFTSSTSGIDAAAVKSLNAAAAAYGGELQPVAINGSSIPTNSSSSGGSSAARCLGPTIPEEGPALMTPSMTLTDTQRHIIRQQAAQQAAAKTNIRDSGNAANTSNTTTPPAAAAHAAHAAMQFEKVELPTQQQQPPQQGTMNGSASCEAAEQSPFQQQASYFELPNGHCDSQQQQQQQHTISPAEPPPLQRQHMLHRASSDDSFIRQRYSSNGGVSGAADRALVTGTLQPSSGNSSAHAAASTPNTGAEQASAASTSTAVTVGGAAADAGGPFAAAAVQATPATAVDPFAAAAVAGSKASLAVSHCLASFFVREEITWDCPKEKALWRGRRASITGTAAGGPASPVACRTGASSSGISPLTRTSATAAGALDVLGNGFSPNFSAASETASTATQPVSIAGASAADGVDGVDGEEGPIYKQVSFSDKHPEVILVPGSVEQRGTDLAAALAGSKPFYRPVTCSGAPLLLTAQLKQLSELVVATHADSSNSSSSGSSTSSAHQAVLPEQKPLPPDHQQQQQEPESHELVVVGRVLVLGLRAAGEGGVLSAAAVRLLPSGRPLALGEVLLPALQGLPPDSQAGLIQSWAQLVLNCLADLLTHEGGVSGLQDMLQGGLALVRNADSAEVGAAAPLHNPQYLAAACEEGEWKVRGQVPAGKTAAAAAGDSVATAAAGGFWEYPAESDQDSLAGAHQQQQQQHVGSSSSASRSTSPIMYLPAQQEQQQQHTEQPLQPLGRPSPSQLLLQRQRYEQQQQQQQLTQQQQRRVRQRRSSTEDDMFMMDEEQQQQQQCEQDEQSVPAQPVQAWEADAGEVEAEQPVPPAAAAAAAATAADAAVAADAYGSASGEVHGQHELLGHSGAPGSGGSSNHVPGVAGNTLLAKQQQQQPMAGNEVDNSSTTVNSYSTDTSASHSSSTSGMSAPRSEPRDIMSQTPAVAAEANTPTSSRLGFRALVPGTSPTAAAGTASSLRSSLRRRSATFSRPAHKAYRIHIAPPVLMLHLKRFQHDGKGRLNKLDTAVKFDFELDLTPFVAPNGPQGAAAAAPSAGSDDGKDEQAAAGSACNEPGSSSSSSCVTGNLVYDLVGVVVHMGTMRGGHYVAYVKRRPQPQQQHQQTATAGGNAATEVSSESNGKAGPEASSAAGVGSSSGMFSSLVGAGRGAAAAAAATAAAAKPQWYYVSDSTVKAVNKSEVAAAQAYMLMYVRRDAAKSDLAAPANLVQGVQQQQQQHGITAQE